jgi:uncharacterized iron-regulated protein
MLLAMLPVLAACGVPGRVPTTAEAAAPPGRLVETATGQVLRSADWLDALQQADYLLLGEVHDQATHHQVRGQWLRSLDRPSAVVVSEHLPYRPDAGPVRFGPDLLAGMTRAGFDPDAWDWPLLEPLYAAIARSGMSLIGGDIDTDALLAIGRDQSDASSRDIDALLGAAPLSRQATRALQADLLASHGGRLSVDQLARMVRAQRFRDASLWRAMRSSGGRPVVLLAGVGHVRLDYGVPSLIRTDQPQSRTISVGALLPGQTLSALASLHTHVWIDEQIDRRTVTMSASRTTARSRPGYPSDDDTHVLAARPAAGGLPGRSDCAGGAGVRGPAG